MQAQPDSLLLGCELVLTCPTRHEHDFEASGASRLLTRLGGRPHALSKRQRLGT
jgi:hypothetical protein